jgi:Mrp family chromosome partitioning ATPase
MPAGTEEHNPAELLDSARWKTLCDTFRQTFSFVIVDSPPMGTVADYDLIQSQCDGVVLVARQDHSNRSRLLKCISSVPQERLVGVLMNCVSPWTLWKAADDAGDPYGYKPAVK